MKSWLERLVPSVGRSGSTSDKIPENLWSKCNSCGVQLYEPELQDNLNVCPHCNHHMRVAARTRLDYFLDPGERVEIGTDVLARDRLKFTDTRSYTDRLEQAQKQTGETEALVVQVGELEGQPLVVAAFEFRFLGGSMSSAVGKRFMLAVDHSLERRIPLVCFATSGGARMQESILSLMQLVRCCAAIERMQRAGIPYISVMVDPVYGGVSASLAILGDINIAEPGALVGFTGPRVIEQNMRIKLPPGFQRAEFLLQHGAIDMIVARADMRPKIAMLLAMLGERTLAKNA